jgi:3-oxoacyl-[acyl-carrier-protein] synthase-3
MPAYLKAISFCTPEKELNNKELNELFPEWSVDKIAKKTGIEKRYISSKDQLSSDLGIQAAEKLFQEHSIDRSSIDFLLFCTQSPDYFLPTTACIVQNRLGLKHTTGALDFNLGCSGYVYGLSLAKGLIAGGIAKNVLLITAETYTKFINQNDKSNRTIFGDAATASLITAERGIAEIKDFVLGTDGSGAGNLIVKNGALRHPEKDKQTTEIVDEFGNISGSDFLYMNGSEIFNFTIDRIPILCDDVLQKNNLNDDQIGWYVFHQANRYVLNFLRKKIGIPESRFFINVEKYANTVSSTIPIALYDLFCQYKEFKGNIMIAGFGVGYSWGGCILSIN